ncbi:MAG: hypothetical protein KC461_12895 [Dehalococcoidia bacterium]|nr:hypothetical protein [Dehalococcoidia bacterium]MCB9483441.1 hypothetical protein [Dehalococcoidia bacterium]MCB9491554.1 hypothetical protein [Dehalococcoidia bacterium]
MAPIRILHRAGNFHELLHMSEHPSVDAIEADIWVMNGRLFAHHERPIGRFLLGNRGLALGVDRVPLEVILEAVQGHSEFVIDLRSWFGDPAPDLARTLALQLDDFSHIHVTCEAWRIADRLREWLPGLNVAYSIRSEKQLRRFIRDVDDQRIRPTPVTVRHTLLRSRRVVQELRARAGRVGAWTVDDVERGLELSTWDVDAIVSNQLTVLNAL